MYIFIRSTLQNSPMSWRMKELSVSKTRFFFWSKKKKTVRALYYEPGREIGKSLMNM